MNSWDMGIGFSVGIINPSQTDGIIDRNEWTQIESQARAAGATDSEIAKISLSIGLRQGDPTFIEYATQLGAFSGGEAATTEYPAYSDPAVGAPKGYAPSASDPNLGGYAKALEVLLANFDTFDVAFANPNAGMDGLIAGCDLQAILSNANASTTLKQAAEFLLQHPEYFHRADVAGGGNGQDGLIQRVDVQRELEKLRGHVSVGDGRIPAAKAKPEAPVYPTPPSEPQFPAPPPPVSADLEEYVRALEVVSNNFTAFDLNNFIKQDGQVGKTDFEHISSKSGYSQEMKQAARYFLDHWDKWDAVGPHNSSSHPTLDVHLGKMRAQLEAEKQPWTQYNNECAKIKATYDQQLQAHQANVARMTAEYNGKLEEWQKETSSAVPVRAAERAAASQEVAPTSSGRSATGSELGKILNDPSLSLEEMILELLESETKDIDGELLATAQELRNKQGEKADSDDAKQNKSFAIDELTRKLQRLLERKRQMVELMSNLSKSFNDMAMAAIRNMRS